MNMWFASKYVIHIVFFLKHRLCIKKIKWKTIINSITSTFKNYNPKSKFHLELHPLEEEEKNIKSYTL